MKLVSTSIDKVAIGLSMICTIHCLLLPVALVMLPALTTSALGEESFHLWLLVAVFPTSLIALTMGCRQHRNLSVLATGVSGLVVLSLAALFGHNLFGETGGKIASVLGASLIALSHYRNHKLCRHKRCDCETNKEQ